MLWLIISISAYLILAIVSLVDKHLLTGPISNPKVYTFYVGTLGLLALLLAPFVGFYVPEFSQIILSFAAGALFIFALFWFYYALHLFEASRVIPAIGGILPLFTFLLVFIFSGGKETLELLGFLGFILLVLGSVLVTYERSKKISLESFKISVVSAFFFALSFVLTKYVYLAHPFWTGFIWMRIGGALAGVCFLFTKDVRKELSEAKKDTPQEIMGIFLLNQAAGAGANILQSWSIALAPLAYIAVINALQGSQYVFLLIFTVFLSLKFPKILKEEISREVLFQKLIATFFIMVGLIIKVIK